MNVYVQTGRASKNMKDHLDGVEVTLDGVCEDCSVVRVHRNSPFSSRRR